jgi:hypothetical protein
MDYTAFYRRRQNSSLWPMWQPQILQRKLFFRSAKSCVKFTVGGRSAVLLINVIDNSGERELLYRKWNFRVFTNRNTKGKDRQIRPTARSVTLWTDFINAGRDNLTENNAPLSSSEPVFFSGIFCLNFTIGFHKMLKNSWVPEHCWLLKKDSAPWS